jgi:hypothetical protein
MIFRRSKIDQQLNYKNFFSYTKTFFRGSNISLDSLSYENTHINDLEQIQPTFFVTSKPIPSHSVRSACRS